MTDIGRSDKIILRDQSDLLIEAMAAEKNDPAKFRTIAFKSDAIGYVIEVNDKTSAIVLKSNINIPVALPFAKLKQMIYAPDFRDGASIDLTLVTGQAVMDVAVPKLADTFNGKSRKPGEPLLITLFVDMDSNGGPNRYLTFPESDIEILEPHCNKKDTASFIQLKNSYNIWFNIPLETFKYAVYEANRDNLAKLDLSTKCSAPIKPPAPRFGP